MPSLHRRLQNRQTRMLVQLGAMTTGIAATLLIAHDEPATRAIGTAVLAVIAIVAIKLALVAINPPGQGTSASRSGTSADQRSKSDEIIARIGALEALGRGSEAAIASVATTQFELQHVREELDRLRSQVD